MAKEAVNDYGLTIKQQKFAEGYVATNNASQALIDAGYAPVVRTDTGELDKSKTAKRATIPQQSKDKSLHRNY